MVLWQGNQPEKILRDKPSEPQNLSFSWVLVNRCRADFFYFGGQTAQEKGDSLCVFVSIGIIHCWCRASCTGENGSKSQKICHTLQRVASHCWVGGTHSFKGNWKKSLKIKFAMVFGCMAPWNSPEENYDAVEAWFFIVQNKKLAFASGITFQMNFIWGINITVNTSLRIRNSISDLKGSDIFSLLAACHFDHLCLVWQQ